MAEVTFNYHTGRNISGTKMQTLVHVLEVGLGGRWTDDLPQH